MQGQQNKPKVIHTQVSSADKVNKWLLSSCDSDSITSKSWASAKKKIHEHDKVAVADRKSCDRVRMRSPHKQFYAAESCIGNYNHDEFCKQSEHDDSYVNKGCNTGCFSRRALRDNRKAVRKEPQRQMSNDRDVIKSKKTTTMKGAMGSGARPKEVDGSDSDGESSTISNLTLSSRYTVKNMNKHNMKSGFLEKPRSIVRFRQKWPHMNQDPRYVTAPLWYDELSFNQFVGGECRTIMRTQDPDEVLGRLRILSKIAYLHEQCGSWEKARATYFAIVSSIEEGEMHWLGSIGHYDIMCPPPSRVPQVEQRGAIRQKTPPPKKGFLLQRLSER